MSIKVDQALVTAVLEAGFEIDIIHENGIYTVWDGANYLHSTGVYTPSANREHAEIRVFPAGKAPFSLANSDESVGLLQVILKYPADTGAFLVKQKAEQVLTEFAIGATFTYSGQTVEIMSSARDGGRVEGGFYQIVVRANYRAFTPR